MKCIEVIAKRTGALSEHMPGVKPHLCRKVLERFCEACSALLDDDQGETTEFCDELEISVRVLRCDLYCAPRSAKQHASNLQKRIKMYLEARVTKEAMISSSYGEMFRVHLESVGWYQRTDWNLAVDNALALVQAHALAKQAFDGFEKLEVAEKGLKCSIPVGYDTPAEFLVHTKYQTQERLKDAQDVLDSILLVCIELLNLKEFPCTCERASSTNL